MLSRWPSVSGSNARRLLQVSGPAAEPIGSALQQSALKLDINQNPFVVQSRIAAARSMVEERINRRLVQQVWDLFIDDEQYVNQNSGRYPWQHSELFSEFNGLSEITLPYPPVQSVIGVYTTDRYGMEQAVPSDVYYATNSKQPCRIRLKPGKYWPDHRGGEGIRIRFTCGYVTPVSLNSDGILVASNHGYNSGDPVRFSSPDGSLPSPLRPSATYYLTNLTPDGFSVVDSAYNAVVLDPGWTGTFFIGEVPMPLVEAVTMLCALNQSGEVPSRIAGVSRMAPIELPVEPAELITPYIWPHL